MCLSFSNSFGLPSPEKVHFNPFADDEILPQRPGVLPHGQRREVLEYGVADAVVIKINPNPKIYTISGVRISGISLRFPPCVTFIMLHVLCNDCKVRHKCWKISAT